MGAQLPGQQRLAHRPPMARSRISQPWHQGSAPRGRALAPRRDLLVRVREPHAAAEKSASPCPHAYAVADMPTHGVRPHRSSALIRASVVYVSRRGLPTRSRRRSVSLRDVAYDPGEVPGGTTFASWIVGRPTKLASRNSARPSVQEETTMTRQAFYRSASHPSSPSRGGYGKWTPVLCICTDSCTT